MAVTNETQDSVSYFCQLLGPFQWKQEYLIETGVYVNVILSATINSVMFPFTTTFNLLLVYIIFFKRKVNRRKSNVSIGYLAITDLAVGVVLHPLFIAANLCRINGRCKICVLDFLIWFIAAWLCRSSMNHLVIVAWERYVAIKHALQYNIIVTRKRLLLGSIAAWFIPILVEGLLLFETNPFVPNIVFLVYIFTCFSLLAYFHAVIFLESRRHRRQIKATTPHDQGQANRSITQEFRAAKTTFIILSCFSICYVPFIVASIVVYLLHFWTSSFNSVFFLIMLWTGSLIFLNSLINPIIYGLRSKEIKNMVKDIFAARLKRIETEDAERKKSVRSQKTERSQRNNTARSQSVRRSGRSLSIPTKLTSTACVNPNKRRRHSLQAVINTDKNSDNQYSFHSQPSDIEFKTINKTGNERNEITVTAVVHVNSVSKQDEYTL